MQHTVPSSQDVRGTQPASQPASQRWIRSVPCEDCRSTLWRRIGGRTVCSNGHIREMHVEEAAEEEEVYRMGGSAVLVPVGGARKQRAALDTRHNPLTCATIWLYVLREQARALVDKKGFPKEAYMAAVWHIFLAYRACFRQNQWLFAINGPRLKSWFNYDWLSGAPLPSTQFPSATGTAAEEGSAQGSAASQPVDLSMLDDEAFFGDVFKVEDEEDDHEVKHERNQSEEVGDDDDDGNDNDEDDDGDDADRDAEENEDAPSLQEAQAEKERKFLKRLIATAARGHKSHFHRYAQVDRLFLRQTLYFLYFAALYIRLPVLVTDFIHSAEEEILPFRQLHQLLKYHFGVILERHKYLQNFIEDDAPILRSIFVRGVGKLASLLRSRAFASSPPLNHVPILSRYLFAAGLPQDLLPPVVRVIQRFGLMESMDRYGDAVRRVSKLSFDRIFAEDRLIAVIIVVARQLVDLDRMHEAEAGTLIADQRWAFFAWLAELEEINGVDFSLSAQPRRTTMNTAMRNPFPLLLGSTASFARPSSGSDPISEARRAEKYLSKHLALYKWEKQKPPSLPPFFALFVQAMTSHILGSDKWAEMCFAVLAIEEMLYTTVNDAP